MICKPQLGLELPVCSVFTVVGSSPRCSFKEINTYSLLSVWEHTCRSAYIATKWLGHRKACGDNVALRQEVGHFKCVEKSVDMVMENRVKLIVSTVCLCICLFP